MSEEKIVFEIKLLRTIAGVEFYLEFRIREKDGLYRFFIHPDLAGQQSLPFKLYPGAWHNFDNWKKIFDFSEELHRLCRFQYAVVSNRMKLELIQALRLSPLTLFDMLLPKKEYAFDQSHLLTFLGYGVLENDKVDFESPNQTSPENLLSPSYFPPDFQEQYEDARNSFDKTTTAKIYVEGLENLEIGAEVHMNPSFQFQDNQNLGKLQMLNSVLMDMRQRIGSIASSRQQALINFFFAEIKKDYPNLDPRKQLRKNV